MNGPSISFGWIQGEPIPKPDALYYQKLANLFPTGDLAPYARWWVAECRRRGNVVAASKDKLTSVAELIAEYEKVKAPSKTGAWAWTQLRIGGLLYNEGKYSEALEHCLAVANGMGPGPEQSMALIHAAYCYGARKQHAESERLLRLVLDQPNVVWKTVGELTAWAPMFGSTHRFWYGPTSSVARTLLSQIDQLEETDSQQHDGGQERGAADQQKTGPKTNR